ncbi:hypothetical protein PISMIDRAFT_433600 [Pisolithus microcarpus 441]|uniref:Uncharacterized protein n=1 Tax=Pisolithus microcarpus 441 TaxID=765257 RepID=A0A0C9XJV9_9AGAM|nr:hypothetical protein PISMIDRAFT_433600 [Pisolithus microcarpus 441]
MLEHAVRLHLSHSKVVFIPWLARHAIESKFKICIEDYLSNSDRRHSISISNCDWLCRLRSLVSSACEGCDCVFEL